jgi:hypothetical protein
VKAQALSAPCPTCEAAPGEVCITRPGRHVLSYPHALRRSSVSLERPVVTEAAITPPRLSARLVCRDCESDLGEIAIALRSSASPTRVNSIRHSLDWVSTHSFRCGACAIKDGAIRREALRNS